MLGEGSRLSRERRKDSKEGLWTAGGGGRKRRETPSDDVSSWKGGKMWERRASFKRRILLPMKKNDRSSK